MKILNTEVYGLEQSCIASGYPMMVETPSESEFEEMVEKVKTKENAEKARMSKLGATPAGSGHGTALQGIIVQFDIDAPIKLWVEMQRYHFFDFVSSSSTMHRLKDFNLNSKDAFDEYTDFIIIRRLKVLQERYNKTKDKEDLLKLLLSAPVGLNVAARMTTNYAQLKTIYNQRKNHRLPQWKVFCDWCDALPYFFEFTGCTRGEK